jgi:hypothetical protein
MVGPLSFPRLENIPLVPLCVGSLPIDWVRQSGIEDHRPLFQSGDLVTLPYFRWDRSPHYKDDEGRDRAKGVWSHQQGFKKPLAHVVERLDLLGWTLACCEIESLASLSTPDTKKAKADFDKLKGALCVANPNDIAVSDGGDPLIDVFKPLGLHTILPQGTSVHSRSYGRIENISTATALHLLALNPHFRAQPVLWRVAYDENWQEGQEHNPLDADDRFLIITEGTSDAAIIKHALNLLRGHIADFFTFVDMERYPFPGAGNLRNFFKGLNSISISNNLIILFDNDTEGAYQYKICLEERNLLQNIRILKLPDSKFFSQFPTVGPFGSQRADINGSAAAIECYLDVGASAEVRWTAYNNNMNQYQGELIKKQHYSRQFLDQKNRVNDYDYSRIESVVDMIISECVKMREAERVKALHRLYPGADLKFKDAILQPDARAIVRRARPG